MAPHFHSIKLACNQRLVQSCKYYARHYHLFEYQKPRPYSFALQVEIDKRLSQVYDGLGLVTLAPLIC